MLIVLILLGVATRLEIPRKIAVSGAVSGNADFDGSKDVNIVTTQSNIAVLTGAMDGNATFTFPSGFNKNNCCIMGIMIKKNNREVWATGTIFNSSSAINGAMPIYAYLNDAGIVITSRDIQISGNDSVSVGTYITNATVKVVLMKIS